LTTFFWLGFAKTVVRFFLCMDRRHFIVGIILCFGISYIVRRLQSSPSVNKFKRIAVVLSGKRMTGKDYVCTKLVSLCLNAGIKTERIAMSDQVKISFAAHNPEVDGKRLFEDSVYKQSLKPRIVEHFEKISKGDQNYFLSQVVNNQVSSKLLKENEIFLFTDIRTMANVEFLKRSEFSHVLWMRITADEESRKQRGWTLTDVDKMFTETEMDTFKEWDYIISNNNGENVQEYLEHTILPALSKLMKSQP